MRRSSLVSVALVSLTAPLAGVHAYQSWAPDRAPTADPVASTSLAPVTAAEPGVRYRPCLRPAKLEAGVCVTHRVRVVVALAAPGVPDAPSSAGPGQPPDEEGPTHPADPPAHEPGPVDDPTDGATASPAADPTVEPTAAPSCEPTDHEEGEEDPEDQGNEELDPTGTADVTQDECDGEDEHAEDEHAEDEHGADGD